MSRGRSDNRGQPTDDLIVVASRRHLWSGGTKYHNKCKWSTDMDAASEIRQLIDRYVTAGGKGDLQGVLDTLTDDVVFLPPNDTPKVGKEELRRWLQPFQEHYTSKDIAQSVSPATLP